MPTVDKLNDVRQRMVRQLIANEFGGRQVDFAEKIGRPDNYVSRLVSAGAHRKGIGERVARHIEQACGKPRGWLDGEVRDAVREPVTLHGIQIDAEAATIGAEWRKLPPTLRATVAQLIHLLVASNVREQRDTRKIVSRVSQPTQ